MKCLSLLQYMNLIPEELQAKYGDVVYGIICDYGDRW